VKIQKHTRWILLICLLALLMRIIPGPRTIDDAYITFRYARNILLGHGLVYNPGEAVLGTTTPLYAFLLSLLAWISGGVNADFPGIALIINTIADAMTCLLIYLLAYEFGHPRTGFATALIWAVSPMSVTFAIGGMETSLVICLITATFYFHFKRRPIAAALCGAMSILARPDALLAVLPLLLLRVYQSFPGKRKGRNNSIHFSELLAFGVPLLFWILIAWNYYGSPIPHSITAKTSAYLLAPGESFIRLLQHYSTPFMGQMTLGSQWVWIGLFLYPILFGLGSLYLIRQRSESWVWLAYPWVYLSVFSMANPLIFRWYLAPPLPALMMGILLGSERISADLRTPLPTYLIAAAAFVLTLNAWTLLPDHGLKRPAPEMAFIKLEQLYQEVGEELRPLVKTGDVIAAGDIGALGYYSRAPILDTLGLVSPEVDHYYPIPEDQIITNYAIPADLIIETQPQYLVVLEVYGRNTFLTDDRFHAAYRLIDSKDTDIYGSEGMLVFERARSE
jgi:arabinofuranosyltransferase